MMKYLKFMKHEKRLQRKCFQFLKSSGVKAGAKINISNILESDHANKNDYVKDFKFRYANRNNLIQEHGFSEDQSQFKSQLAELEEKGSYLEKIQNVLGNSNEVKIDEFVKLNVLEDYDLFINFRSSLEDFLGKYWTFFLGSFLEKDFTIFLGWVDDVASIQPNDIKNFLTGRQLRKLYKAQFFVIFFNLMHFNDVKRMKMLFLLEYFLSQTFLSRIMEKHELIMSDIASYKVEKAQKEFIQLNRKLYELESASILAGQMQVDIPAGVSSGPKKNYTDKALLEYQVRPNTRSMPVRELVQKVLML